MNQPVSRTRQSDHLSKLVSSRSKSSLLGCAAAIALAAGTFGAPGAVFAQDQQTANGEPIETIVVTGTRFNTDAAPAKATLETVEPQTVINKSYIDNFVPATSDYVTILAIVPGLTGGDSDGPGLSDGGAKNTLRGMSDGQFVIQYDGIPFGDTNGPTHHNISYFPASTIGSIVVDRGPGNAGNMVAICDIDEGRANEVKSLYHPVNVTVNSNDIFNNPEIDVVILSTPTSTHFNLAKQTLLSKKHVLIEKPICTSVAEVEELMAIAEANRLILMVDHIFLYNTVVRQLKKYITDDFMGKVNYIDATRINLGIYQEDTNVLWDLACHDISIINYLITEKPTQVRAIGRRNPVHGIEDVAYLFLYYSSGMLVQINSSWASPVKMRKMIIGGEKRMIIYDDIEATNKLTIYDYKQPEATDVKKSKLIDYRLGDITIPKYEISEALKNVIEEFYTCVLNDKKPLANGENALAVVKILEKAQESLKLNGAIISLS